MKVPASIRQLHEDQKIINDRLRKTVDDRMLSLINPRWHYESRVKELTSFALKIETGRFDNPQVLEDFFACTIVVANATEIVEAENSINDNFVVTRRRPRDPRKTHKAPDSFPFDDLRLYVTLPQGPAIPPTDLSGVVFEIQIKTFLQHAWSIATHDLLYKTDDANWNKERIAYQIKAMLEHAELSIQEAESLAACGALAKEDPHTVAIRRGIELAKSQWSKDELPEDVRRLASNITALINALGLNIVRLQEILNDGKAQRAGMHPSNLSPYAIVVQYLLIAEKEKMISLLMREEGKRQIRVFIPAEVEMPVDIDRSILPNALLM